MYNGVYKFSKQHKNKVFISGILFPYYFNFFLLFCLFRLVNHRNNKKTRCHSFQSYSQLIGTLAYFLQQQVLNRRNPVQIIAIFFSSKKDNVQYRSRYQRYSVKQLFLKILQYLQEPLFKKRLQHRCFPVNNVKFLETPSLKNICES